MRIKITLRTLEWPSALDPKGNFLGPLESFTVGDVDRPLEGNFKVEMIGNFRNMSNALDCVSGHFTFYFIQIENLEMEETNGN